MKNEKFAQQVVGKKYQNAFDSAKSIHPGATLKITCNGLGAEIRWPGKVEFYYAGNLTAYLKD